MNDVTKKRLIGVAVLVIIGVLVPLLLSKCMHGGSADDGRSSMRVYNVDPNGAGATTSASNETPAVDGSTGASQAGATDDSEGDQQASTPRTPEALSPQSAARDYGTPPVRGDDDGQASSSSSASSSSQSQSQASSSNDSQPATRSSAPAAQRNDSASGWVVQVAAFGDLSNAQSLASQLSGQYRASYAQAEVNGKTWYRVNVGPFTSESAARSTADSLRSQGRKPLVRHLP